MWYLYKKNLCAIPRKDLDIQHKDNNSEYESFWIEIINSKSPNTIIGVTYRHPKYSDKSYLSYLHRTLHTLNKEKKHVIITGDFNYNLMKHEKVKAVGDFLNLMYKFLYSPHIIGPTRFPKNEAPSLVDNIFVNTLDKHSISGNLFNKISDHLPNFIMLQDINAH